MNCKDFNEIADSYLSDELTVETNHSVFSHLENCSACRDELAARREVRDKLFHALKKSPEFRIDPLFAANLKASLRKDSLNRSVRFDWKIFVPVFAALLIMTSIGFVLLYNQKQVSHLARAYLVELTRQAIGDHQDCALKKLKIWEANAGKTTAERTTFVKSLQVEKTEVLAAHDCFFEGKRFTHYILRREGKIISVMNVAAENFSTANLETHDSIVCERQGNLQVASFQNGENRVFVISDLSETENLNLARSLSDSLKQQV